MLTKFISRSTCTHITKVLRQALLARLPGALRLPEGVFALNRLLSFLALENNTLHDECLEPSFA